MFQPNGPSDDEEGEGGEGGEGGAGGGGGEGEEEEEEEDTTVYQYVPPVSKPWVSQGSELEIEEESMAQARKKVGV